ncbi:MAG: hypothetical protein WCF30_07665 [Terracidiphilus sp.]
MAEQFNSQDSSLLLEHFKDTLRKLCTEVENLTIENLVYFDAILESNAINVPTLKEQVAAALLDPKKRKEVHQMYSEMWKAVEDSGLDAFFQGLLQDLPPTDKPN